MRSIVNSLNQFENLVLLWSFVAFVPIDRRSIWNFAFDFPLGLVFSFFKRRDHVVHRLPFIVDQNGGSIQKLYICNFPYIIHNVILRSRWSINLAWRNLFIHHLRVLIFLKTFSSKIILRFSAHQNLLTIRITIHVTINIQLVITLVLNASN